MSRHQYKTSDRLTHIARWLLFHQLVVGLAHEEAPVQPVQREEAMNVYETSTS